MATPVYHIACYKAAKGRDASPRPAKWGGHCTHCGQRIFKGDPITWSRRFGQESEGNASASGTEETPKETSAGNAEATFKVDWQDVANNVLPYLHRKVEPKVTIIHVNDTRTNETKDMGLQHRMFPTLLKWVKARRNVWLAGPAGSGKTTAGEKTAEALGLPFYFIGTITDQFALSGYYNATGQYVPTNFRKAWENGGVFMLDDFDGSDPTAAIWLNGALANGVCPFPDGMVKKHPDCVLIVSANTWGQGGTAEYVGRLKQDAAFLNRFVKLEWLYDEDLELATCADMAWCKHVQAIRKRVKEKGIRALITTRASYNGAAGLAAGLTWEEVEEAVLAAEMTPEQWKTVKGNGYAF